MFAALYYCVLRLKLSSDIYVCVVRQNCAEKNIRLAEKYYKFGWDSASRKKIGGGVRRSLTKFGAAALGSGAARRGLCGLILG